MKEILGEFDMKMLKNKGIRKKQLEKIMKTEKAKKKKKIKNK